MPTNTVNIYETAVLQAAIETVGLKFSFLRDRYFPARTLYANHAKILVDIKDGDSTLAPFVAPYVGGKVVNRNGYSTFEIDAPYIAPKRVLGIHDLQKRAFGEPLNTERTPEQRAMDIMLDDYREMDDMIARREEKMCADVMNTNGFTADYLADDNTTVLTQNVKYYTENANPAEVTIATKWNANGKTVSDKLADLVDMAAILRKNGNAAVDLLVNSVTAAKLIEDEDFRALLDNRRMEMGEIVPQNADDNFASAFGRIAAPGVLLNIICYDGFAVENGKEKKFIADGRAILGAPGAGHLDYGAVTQMEQSDLEWHTYSGARVPQYLANPYGGGGKSLTITSRPLPQPNKKNPFVVADLF